MSKHPATVALLGLLALAGFSKSDQLKDLLMRAEARVPENGRNTEFIDELKTWFEESNVHSTLNGAIDGLEPLFVGSKGTSKAVSWMSDAISEPITASELETFLSHSTLNELNEKTGIHRAELLEKLAAILPDAIANLSGPRQHQAAG